MQSNCQKKIFLVSACLMGLCTRYDGNATKSHQCASRLGRATWIPVCPEQLGGLTTPREAADLHGGSGVDVLRGRARVITKSGADVTSQFIKGAEQILAIAKEQNIDTALLKARSPSCAVTEPMGVTSALLQLHGIECEEF